MKLLLSALVKSPASCSTPLQSADGPWGPSVASGLHPLSLLMDPRDSRPMPLSRAKLFRPEASCTEKGFPSTSLSPTIEVSPMPCQIFPDRFQRSGPSHCLLPGVSANQPTRFPSQVVAGVFVPFHEDVRDCIGHGIAYAGPNLNRRRAQQHDGFSRISDGASLKL